MKVLHICKVYLPTHGGVQEVVSRICEGLHEDFEFEILTTARHAISENFDGIKVTRVRSFFEVKSMPVAPALLVRLWQKFRHYDRVCVHYPFPLADLAVAVYPFRIPRLTVYWHSEIVSQKFLQMLVKPFTWLMLRRAEQIVVSAPLLVHYSRMLRRHRHKCVVIPFGLKDYSKKYVRQPVDVPRRADTPIKLLAIGRHVEYKGFDVLLEAIQDIDCQLKIVGNGPLLEHNRKLSSSLGVGNKVEFVASADDHQIREHIAECDIFVLPSKLESEAFALVQVEAMSFGKPVINTDLASGVPWVSRHHQEGLTAVKNDSHSLAACILRLQSDANLYAACSSAARERYLETFSLDHFLADTAQLYRQ